MYLALHNAATNQQSKISYVSPNKFEEFVMIKDLNSGKKESGFTMPEIFVTLAIAATLAAIAVPGFSGWLPGYRLKSAARDLYSNFQLTKLSAVRTGSRWAIVFDSGVTPGRYYICSDAGANGNWEGPVGDDRVEKTVSLADYQSGVDYGPGNATDDIPGNGAPPGDSINYAVGATNDVVEFNLRGICNAGQVYLQNMRNNTSYGVGTNIVGTVTLQKWSGGSWQ
jgi:prepilin-type N-terminal cleavage/methylation domain-containing protein